jgi:putative YphP/YqiW family bacilliredoxin
MYPEDLVKPMRAELTSIGFQELKSAAEVAATLEASSPDETAFVVINSVCGCAAGGARPGVKIAVENGIKVDKLLTVFAGQDTEAVSAVRELCHGYAPSSPAMAFFKGGKIQHMIERRDIEGFNKLQIAEKISKYCSDLG